VVSGPLVGTRVVDLGRFVAGSYVAMLLASLGADVVKIEVPPTGDPYRGQGTAQVGDETSLFLSLNGGKRSLALDLRHPHARVVLDRLIDTADVLVHNARPGSLDSYGLAWDDVHRQNPHCVYATISGYGDVGPDAGRGGFDLVLQADGGLMSVTGVPDGPPVAIGAPLLDIGAGVACLAGILAALLERQRTGMGIRVRSSLLESSLAGLTTLAAAFLVDGRVPGPTGGHSPLFAPYGAFRTADGWIVLAGAGSDPLWRALCDVIGAPELFDDARFTTNADRVRHREALVAEVESRLTTDDTDAWLTRLAAVGVPASRRRDLDELLASAQVEALGAVHTVEHPSAGAYRTVGAPFRLGDDALGPAGPAPVLGDGTRAVLVELGFDEAAIDELAADKVVVL
jgi:crotonobetainyl-CoA:carnitine CoA-transferase CaiB-like acyl-CoA transferase